MIVHLLSLFFSSEETAGGQRVVFQYNGLLGRRSKNHINNPLIRDKMFHYKTQRCGAGACGTEII